MNTNSSFLTPLAFGLIAAGVPFGSPTNALEITSYNESFKSDGDLYSLPDIAEVAFPEFRPSDGILQDVKINIDSVVTVYGEIERNGVYWDDSTLDDGDVLALLVRAPAELEFFGVRFTEHHSIGVSCVVDDNNCFGSNFEEFNLSGDLLLGDVFPEIDAEFSDFIGNQNVELEMFVDVFDGEPCGRDSICSVASSWSGSIEVNYLYEARPEPVPLPASGLLLLASASLTLPRIIAKRFSHSTLRQ
ncbi:MAG: hypothetical protein ACQEUZ_17525 [Pseudomonadota bacterium]